MRLVFVAVLALIRLLEVESLEDLPSREKFCFAELWYKHLHSLGRINMSKTKTHYYADIMNSIKNATANAKSKNPIPQ